MGEPTLGAKLVERDAAAFVGRRAELVFLERHLSGEASNRVVFVHGPGGIGKSTLLRELARRAERRGFAVRWLEGRDLPPVPDALEDSLADVCDRPRSLLILDSFERIAGTSGYLRRAILPTLPAGCLVIIASRQRPDDGWLQGGWERAVDQLEVGPLSPDEARALTTAAGVSPPLRSELVAWARGSPLALAIAGDVSARDRTWRPGEPLDDQAGLSGALINRLVESEVEGPHWDTLAVAAIARSVTVAMLRDVLTDHAAREEYDWLAGRSFVDRVGDGIALHHLVGEALRADLRRRERERERELRRRIADHLYERARRGEVLMAIDLSHLIDSTEIRWGYSWEASARYQLDDPREGDVDVFDAELRGTRHEALWLGSRAFFDDAPEHVGVVRDRDGQPRGYTVALTPATAPALAASDPVLGPRLEHARSLAQDDTTVVFRDMVDLSRDRSLHVVGMLGLAGMLRAAHANPRYTYLIIDPNLGGAERFAAALGARHVSALDTEVGGVRLECHLVDHGPGGMAAHGREVVYRELGLALPERQLGMDDMTTAVREALRNVQRPDLLARSELASGETVEERAASVRTLLDGLFARAFGEGPGEDLLRGVLARGYLDPAGDHELAAKQLSLSRPAYFRRLRAVSERLSNQISEVAGHGVRGWLQPGRARTRAVSLTRVAHRALSERDLDRLIALTDERVELSAAAGPLAAGGGSYRGHDGLARYIEDLGVNWRRIELQAQEFHAIDDERVLVLGRVRAWNQRGLVDSASASVWTVRDERVVSIQGFADAGQARGALDEQPR